MRASQVSSRARILLQARPSMASGKNAQRIRARLAWQSNTRRGRESWAMMPDRFALREAVTRSKNGGLTRRSRPQAGHR